MAVTVGTGATLTFTGQTFNLTSISMTGMSRDSIETSHLATTGGKTFIPGDLYDPGSIECEFIMDDAPNASEADIEGFLGLTAAAFTVTMDSGQGNWQGTAFCTDVNFTMPLEDLATGSLTLKITGDITTADA